MSQQAWVPGPLGRRVLAMFVAVSLSAAGLVAALAMRAVQTETVGLEAGQRARAERAIVAALGQAFTATGSWESADLTTARALAQTAGLQVVVLDATGGPVARLQPTPEPTTRRPTPRTPSPGTRSPGTGTRTTPAPGSASPSTASTSPTTGGPGRGRGSGGAGPGNGRTGQTDALPPTAARTGFAVALVAVRAGTGPAAGPDAGPTTDRPGSTTTPAPAAPAPIPIVVGGRTVGRALIEPVPQVEVPAETARRAILRTVGWAALAAGGLAAIVSFVATRRITRPLVALAAAARAVERGDPRATEMLRPGPGELGSAAAAFAQMADTVRRTDALRRTMAADVAHELRTPVTILRGGTEELLDGLAPMTRGAVVSLHEEVLRLERLVDDLAALSAAEAAGLSLRLAPVDLGELAHRAAGPLRPHLEEGGHRVTVAVPEHPADLVVDGDADRLVQVVTNLLVNANAYTPPGGRIHLDVRRRGDRIALTVADTGPGISPDVLPHVFERFYRGSPCPGHQGTGIGLAVVAELVRAHGGTVAADSPPGQGAVFTVLLPARTSTLPTPG